MTPEQNQLLFEKYLNGLATSAEIETLMEYQDGFQMKMPEQQPDANTETRLKQRLYESIHGGNRGRRRRIWWPAVAAGVILVIAGQFYLNLQRQAPVARRSAGRPVILHDAQPGSSKAVLILGSGRQIVLTDSASGTLATQGNATISKHGRGLLKYEVGQAAKKEQPEIVFNTISIPKGGQYQLVLADGTKIWLNASSTLRFPTEFAGRQREVELSGEAYFEVAENKAKPFRVKFNQEVVEVLGTHFNIMAYKDEEGSQTTLLEGSVNISKPNAQALLRPGQQAVSLAGKDEFAVQPARTEEVMAWKDGYFFFRDKDIRFIMRQVARWYDVDVVYRGDLQDQVYGGRVSRYKNISGLLSKLELTGTIHFKIEDKKITVSR